MKKIKGIFSGGGSKNKNASANTPGAETSGAHSAAGYPELREKDLPKIHKAAWTGDIAKVKQLAKKDPTALDKENRTPLHLACVQGHTKVVQELLEWNVRTNVGDSHSKTPLMKAVECGQEECVRLLLEYKTDVDVKDWEGNSALHIAVREGYTSIIAMLISAGANVNLKNKEGQTPLILSVQDVTKRDDHTRLLLEHNADPNAVDNNQRSALHHACMGDGINHVKLLLQHNASTVLKDIKGWTAEDCAMMKAHHACSQVVFDHNLKQRKLLTGSIPSTPRNTDSANVSRHTTPRDKSTSSDLAFGLPQTHQEDADDSDDQTVSKHSLHENRQDSWADDTDISSATDDKLKGAPKTSLTKHLKIESDEGEEGHEDIVDGASAKPGDVKRPMYSRTPTPDGDLRRSPGTSPFSSSTPSKIPVKKNTSVNGDNSDDEDDSAPLQRNRVSFSDHQQYRNISATDDDTDIEDDEEEVEPTKKRRIETPQDHDVPGGYTPTGVTNKSVNKLSKDSYKALMSDLGMEDISDVSDPDLDESESNLSLRDAEPKQSSQSNTPRGILKMNNSLGKPPSVQNPVETDQYWDSEEDDEYIPDQERKIIVEAEVHPAAAHSSRLTPSDKEEDSDWDSTRHSGTDRENQSINVREEVESPEVDSDLEDTLNPEKSIVSKDPTVNEDISAIQDSNTVEVAQDSTTTVDIVQESTTPDNASSQQDRLANTGDINALLINELNESTDLSQPGSRSSSVAMETQRAVTVIEARTKITDNDAKSPLFEDSSRKKSKDKEDGSQCFNENIRSYDSNDSWDESLDKEDTPKEGDLDNIEEPVDIEDVDHDNDAEGGNEEEYDDVDREDIEEDDDVEEIEEMINEEIDHYDREEKSEHSQKETSIKDEIERSVSEGKRHKDDDFKVMDRLSAPKFMLEYEPSTTDADDSDTLDTESVKEDFVGLVKSDKKKKASSSKRESGPKVILSRNGSISSDKEVARALAGEFPSPGTSRQMVPSQGDFYRGSTEPTTQDTMGEQTSLAEDDDSEVNQTSQWDSSHDEYTPRTPRDKDTFRKQGASPDVQDFEYDEDEDSHHSNRDEIHDAVTSFGVRQKIDSSPGVTSVPTPEPQSDSSQQRSRDTPDPPTSSTSMQRTVIQATVMEPDESPRRNNNEQNDDDDDNWDSEDEVQSDEEEEPHLVVGVSKPVMGVPSPTVVGVDSANNTPRTPRGQASTATDEESVSEWELERQKEKEKREQEKRLLQEMEEEEERQMQWEQEERRRQAEIEREAQAELEREQQEAEDDDDESNLSDFSENVLPDSARQQDSDHSHPSQNASQKSHPSEATRSQRSEVSTGSQRSDHSHGSQLTSPRVRELKKPPPKLVVTKFIPPIQTPRENKTPVTLGEVENESPGPMAAMYDDMVVPEQDRNRFASPNQRSGVNVDFKGMYGGQGHEDDEEESDNDIEEIVEDEQIEIPEQFNAKNKSESEGQKTAINVNVFGSKDNFSDKKDNLSSPNKFGSTPKEQFTRSGFITQQYDDDDEEEEEEFEEGVEEETILPDSMKKVETAKPNNARAEFPGQFPVNGQVTADDTEVLVSEPPPLPKSGPPGKAMSLQSDGQSVEDEELDYPRHSKPQGPSLLPDLSGTTGLYSSGLEVPFDDDGLSVTSTENGDISSSYRPENLPYGKDMLVNMNLNDSGAVLKLQEHLREHRKQLEFERNQKMLLDSKYKQATKDKADLQKMINSFKYQKSALEQAKLDLEAKIRNLEYSLNDEEEKKKNAELLLKKTKEQLTKKEEQFTHEMEAKQRAELAMRNVQMELRSAQNQMKDLEEEKAELERQLSNEKNARQLQEKINEEQLRLQQHLREENLKTSSQKDEADRSLELADDDIKHAHDLVDKYKNEIAALKAELQRQRTRLTDENGQLSSENEKLQQRVEDLRNEVKDHEEALTQLTVQQNLHNSKLASETTMLSNSLDKERVAREKLEAELESLRTRLQSTTSQLEKSQLARNDFERRLHTDREEWARQLDMKDKELTSLKEKLQSHIHALNATESKLNAVENELQISNTTLLERTNQCQQAQRDVQYYKASKDSYDANIKHEKELNAKHIAKIESLQDKLSSLQHENLSLKQQVETAQLLASDRAGHDLQDKLNTMIASLKADHEKAKSALEDRNTNLQDTITRLREDLRNSENRRSNLEQDIRKLNQEQNDIIRKLSIAEASLDVASKAREHLEQERLALKMEIEKLQQKYNSAQEKTIEAQTRMGELVERLERTEQSRLISTQQLVDTSATMQAFNLSKSELEESYQKLQVDNVRLDAELKHEKQKNEHLQRDLADSQKVRSSLEALCSNLKSTNAHLEEKLGPEQLKEVTASDEVLSRNMILREAEDHKGLWEQEVLSRSKLGLRIAQLERHKQETTNQLEEEKRRSRKALEQKKMAELKLESEQEKCQTLQKEVASLKAYLKVAKKRLKEPGDDAMDSNENRMSTLHSAFDKERHAMEDMLVSVKAQLEHMKIQLQDEVEEKERMHHKNQQLETELKTIKKLERSVQKIDRSKRKLEEEFRLYKNSVETGYAEKSTVDEMRKDIESRYRQELNRKLDEVNSYLEEQARTRQRLDLSREEQDAKIRQEKKRFEEECIDLRIKYEQAVAKLETKEMESKRFRDLYESEMQWRMRLSEQLYRSTDKAFAFKNNVERQKNRMHGSLNNLSMNGHTLDLSRINGSLADDALSNRLRAELDRSIAKHLEAAPHDQFRPVLRADDPVLGSSNFAKASADYIEVLKRKYCV